ncbi:MAG TPA: proton-conducting transporter membrane subunit [Nitrospira sp.]|nr:proton-conducting transporter membrane subunit [Nitrospira sp.]
MLTSVALLVPLLPLLTTITVIAGRGTNVRKRVKFALWPIAAAFVGAVATLVLVAADGPLILRLYDPAIAGSFPVPVGFYVDRLSAVMMVLISGIGTIIYAYSIEYMQQEPHERRYFALLGIAVAVLLCMVSSGNLMMLFVLWQVLSYLLYLLIHNHTHAGTLDSAFRTFALLRTGDVAFLAGTALAYMLYGTLEFPELFAVAAQSTATIEWLPGLECSGATGVTLLLLVGAMSKSAQFPFHVWLPRYLYAPTPVTALLHAGIINAGGFLINRLAPLFGLSSPTLHLAFLIGTLTAVLGASMMLAQNDVKNMLGFSTIGQMGYMVMECGLGAFALAVFHLIAHGLFKATVFLNCGDVIRKARIEPHFPHREHVTEDDGYSPLTWATGFVTTLLIPLLILLLTHGVLQIPLLEAQGTVIFLFFIWITSSQAILTLTRLRAVASWKVSAAMLLTLLFVVFVYLFAVESFTAFLYPDADDVALYFKTAQLPSRLFDMMIGAATLTTVIGWVYVYVRAQGRSLPLPTWIDRIRIRLYVLFLNRLYVDEGLQRVARAQLAAIRRFDEPAQG